MATSSLDTTHYSIKEFQLLVKDAPVVPAEIQPFVPTWYPVSLVSGHIQGL